VAPVLNAAKVGIIYDGLTIVIFLGNLGKGAERVKPRQGAGGILYPVGLLNAEAAQPREQFTFQFSQPVAG
jgi:hypothetical protein